MEIWGRQLGALSFVSMLLHSLFLPAAGASNGAALLFSPPLELLQRIPGVHGPQIFCHVRLGPLPVVGTGFCDRQLPPRRGFASLGHVAWRRDRALALYMQQETSDEEEIIKPKSFAPWVARSESRRVTANLMEMLRTEPGRARAYFEALRLEGKADSFHFSVMMDASPDIAGAQALLNQMRNEGLVPQTTSFNVLLKKLCLEGNMDAAEDLLLEMQDSGIPPDERSYTQLVCGYSDLGNTELAQRVFERMQQAGFVRHLNAWEDLVAHLQIKVNTANLASMLSKGADYRSQTERFYQGLVASNATDVVLFNIMLNSWPAGRV